MSTQCKSCLKPNANFNCLLCTEAVCKHCVDFIDESHCLYLDPSQKPQSGTYCPQCFTDKIKPRLENYETVLEVARDVYVFYNRTQSKETRLCDRTQPKVKVENCVDEEDVLIRLAFVAAQKGYNAIIDVEASSQKNKDGSYTLVSWKGVGIPSNIDKRKVD